MQQNNLAVFSPLHAGRSFICYRDVNKAIEKHREIYGLRLVLKKAVKLENYCLTVDQMRDLNFRLKYGQLDYQCSVDNGRPGRPGNDERCPRLVRLRLSPDARTLVVYDTHVHEPAPRMNTDKGQSPPGLSSKGLSPQRLSPQSLSPQALAAHSLASCPVPLAVLPPPALVPLSQFRQTSPTLALPASSSPLSTPSPLQSHEKITVKLKKSQFSPNEMVVVGSARDAQEQLELRNSPEKPLTPSYISPVTIEKITKPLPPKFSENLATPKARKPTVKSTEKVTITPVKASSKPMTEKVVARPPDKVTIKPIEKAITKPLERPAAKGEKNLARQSKVPTRPPPRSNERAAGKNGTAVSTAYTNGNSLQSNGLRTVNGNKKLAKKKKAKQSEQSFDLTSLAPLDTELGVTEKQQLAHGVLLRLLRVTSQLPMIEFSHALDTLETLTDAYKLEQRVNLTILHDQEEKCDNLYGGESYELIDLEAEEYYDDYDPTPDHRLAITQVDGPADDAMDTHSWSEDGAHLQAGDSEDSVCISDYTDTLPYENSHLSNHTQVGDSMSISDETHALPLEHSHTGTQEHSLSHTPKKRTCLQKRTLPNDLRVGEGEGDGDGCHSLTHHQSRGNKVARSSL